MRVLRVYHAGRDPAHRARERELLKRGVDVTLVVPSSWPTAADEQKLSAEPFPMVELAVSRWGDVNRHRYDHDLGRVLKDIRPDVLDVHEEPFSVAARQWLAAAPSDVPVVTYTAQNIDKRLPPPFFGYEKEAHRRTAALYPCSRQAASVARGKGFGGLIEVIPLGFDDELFGPGTQSLDAEVVTIALIGRLVPEKGVRDAVRVVAAINDHRPARLLLIGAGPEAGPAADLARALGVGERVEVRPWESSHSVAQTLRGTHVLLVPSTPTTTWTEQFGRVIVEAQASGAVVAGYAVGSIPEVAGAPAVLAHPGDADGLAAAVTALIRNSQKYQELRRQGVQLNRERGWDAVASAQLALYQRVIDGSYERVRLPRSPRQRRVAARIEFGDTATSTSGDRPFALPLLRAGGAASAALAKLIDAGGEARARLPGTQRLRSTRS